MSLQSGRWRVPSIVGAVAASLLASLCCIGHFTYRRPKAVQGGACGSDACGCQLLRSKRLGRSWLWVATALVIGIWSFPYVAERLFG